MSEMRQGLVDVLIIAGSVGVTLSVVGIIYLPDVNAKIHAATKGVVVGTWIIMAAAWASGPSALFWRVLLVGLLLLLTSPVAAHALARLVWLSHHRRGPAGTERHGALEQEGPSSKEKR